MQLNILLFRFSPTYSPFFLGDDILTQLNNFLFRLSPTYSPFFQVMISECNSFFCNFGLALPTHLFSGDNIWTQLNTYFLFRPCVLAVGAPFLSLGRALIQSPGKNQAGRSPTVSIMSGGARTHNTHRLWTYTTPLDLLNAGKKICNLCKYT